MVIREKQSVVIRMKLSVVVRVKLNAVATQERQCGLRKLFVDLENNDVDLENDDVDPKVGELSPGKLKVGHFVLVRFQMT